VRGQRVADIACGTGYGTQLLAQAGATSVHGVDLSLDAVEFARKHYPATNAQFSAASAEALTLFADGVFDFVVSFETIEHLPNVDAYLNEMFRILRPGGKFLVSTPDRRIGSVFYRWTKRPANRFHVREYTLNEMLALLSGKFRVEAVYGQAYVSRWLVFWPVQVGVKSACRLLGTSTAREFKDRLYSGGGNVEVLPEKAGIAKYWLFLCSRP
jgi:ubiquinone/menaquinone biosynthesis C-methylase UbiE